MLIKEFLDLFSNEVVICHPYQPSKNSGMKHNMNLEEALVANKSGVDVYFIPNSGGVRITEINTINACFVDLDAGKEAGNYLAIDKVESKKIEMLTQIKQFPLSPTVIVETRNGYQVYWVLKERKGVIASDWELVQRKLMTFFDCVGSDKSIIKLNQLMRLPNTEWVKGWTGLDRFYVRITEIRDCQFTIEELKIALQDREPYKKKDIIIKARSIQVQSLNVELIKIRDIIGIREKLKTALSAVISVPTEVDKNNHTKDYIKELLISCMYSISNLVEPLKASSREELYKIISILPLNLLLDLPVNQKFNCIFHNDKTPSANIWIDESGVYRYKCFGSGCEFGGTMINVVAKILGADKSEAIELIKSIFNIQLETKWQKDTKESLIDYENYLSSEEFALNYPTVFNLIKPHIEKLKVILQIARQIVLDQNLIDHHNMTFYTSIRYLAQQMFESGIKGVSDPATLNKRVLLFVHLGLIERVDENLIPEKIRDRLWQLSKVTKENGKKIDCQYHISLYSIPKFSEEVIEAAEQKAKEFIESNMRKTGYSRNMVISALGKVQADKIYVQSTETKFSTSLKAFYFNYKAHAQSLILVQGYFSEKQLLNRMKGYSTYKKSVRSKELLPLLIKELGLRVITVNVRTRGEYGVISEIPSRTIIFVLAVRG